jgi:ethanolamine utilization protein
LDIEELVGMITQEVMSRIPSSTNSTVKDKKKVLVISSCEDELTMVKELVLDKYEVLEYNNEDVNLKNYEHIIVTNLCNKGLSSMALGLCNDNVQAFIVEALFNGKKIHVLKEGIQYRRYSKNANEALYNLYNQYECKIMSYGAIIVQQSDLLKSMETGANYNDMHSEIVAESETVVSENTVQSHQVVEINNKRLITESDLKKLYMNGIKEVNLIKKAILTPLAQDFIRIKRLKINRV